MNSKDKYLKLQKHRQALIEYVAVGVLTGGHIVYVVIASLVALWIISPGLAAIAATVGFLLVMVGAAAAPRKKGGEKE